MTLSIRDNVDRVRAEVESAAAGRPVKIIGVTKTVPPERIGEAYQAGLRTFGENKIQEALHKMSQLEQLSIEWHFIGHLQTNKARDAVRNFSCIHSIDSLKLLQQVEKEAHKTQKKIDVLLEVNLGGEESKYGFTEDALPQAIETSATLQWSRLSGLMIIPPYEEDPEKVRPYFQRLRFLAGRYQLPQLSMGMSHDYRIAIEEGATMVRVGTAIFGERDIASK
jgi:pyridoxal phosphate enzyme (YggS family)